MKVEVKNLVKEYNQGEERTEVLDKINLEINNGDFIVITGRSGTGKTTLLNIIAGLTKPTSGSVLWDGQDIFDLQDKELSALRNAKIGCVPQVPSVLANLTVLDNVRLPFYLAKRAGDPTEDAKKILETVGIGNLAERLPKKLSGGQLKRVAIARAMINGPSLLLVDEPTGDLDDQTTTDVMKIFKRLAENGTAVLMITHDNETVKYATRRYDMVKGKLLARS